MIETSGPQTHQHASPHITDNYSFRSLRAPIVSGDPRVSDTLWGSPISLPPSSPRAPTHPVFLLLFPRFHPRCPRFTWMPSSIVPRFFFEEGMDDRKRYIKEIFFETNLQFRSRYLNITVDVAIVRMEELIRLIN